MRSANETTNRARTGPPAHGRGFSLAEMIIVLTVVALLSAIAVPRFAGAMQSGNADRAARKLAADLRLAQARAIQTQQQQSVVFSKDGLSYTLAGMTDPNHPSRSYVVLLNQPPYTNTVIAGVDLSGSQILTFDRFGSPSTPGTVVLAAGKRTRTVRIVAGAGRIDLE